MHEDAAALRRAPPPTWVGAWAWTGAAAAPALVLAAVQALSVWPFFSDDAFISLRYAERLLAGDGLTWTDGERVEGYSNLLWVLLTAALGRAGVDLVTAARLCGAATTALALVCLARALRPRDLASALVAAVPPLAVASTQTVAVWTLGGLEGPLALLLLAWGFGALVRALESAAAHAAVPAQPARARLLWLGVPFALACWARPDAPLWALCAGAGLAVAHGGTARERMRRALWFGLPALFAVAAQLGFRVAYYGDVVPNTAHVKAEFDPASFDPGLDYVRAALAVMPGLAIAAAAGCLVALCRRATRAAALVLLLPVLAWLAYLAAIGGDHFPGRRLMHGALAPLALLAGIGLTAIGPRTLRAAAAIAVALAIAIPDTWLARTDPRTLEAKSEIWEWRGKVLGEALARAFATERPLLAVDAAGALPFYSRLPALDMLGLCDRTIATTPFPAWLATVAPGTPKPPGHLRGNGAYVMDRAPDLILFNNPPGLPLPVFVSACEFESDPRFLDGYRCVLLKLADASVLPDHYETQLAPLWVRLDGAVGVRREPERITIPAWLFGSLRLPGPAIGRYQPPGTDPAADAARAQSLAEVAAFYGERRVTAVPVAHGALALDLPAGGAARFRCALGAGTWRARCEPPECGASIVAVGQPEAPGGGFRVAHPAEVELELRAPATAATATPAGSPSARPQRVVLERTGD